jgi:hypothetical protein
MIASVRITRVIALPEYPHFSILSVFRMNKRDAHREQTSLVPSGSGPVQSWNDLVNTEPTLSITTPARSQCEVWIATESVTVDPSFIAVPMTLFLRIWLNAMMGRQGEELFL